MCLCQLEYLKEDDDGVRDLLDQRRLLFCVYANWESDYIARNKAKAEVDFLMTKNRAPWLLVEAKTSDTAISTALGLVQRKTGAAHAFQVVRDLPYSGADAFSYHEPIAVSAQSFLSQLF